VKISTYQCSYCPTMKGATNHWWLRYALVEAHFWLIPWDEDKAQSEDHEHICSESCALKALAKWLGKASGNVVKRERGTYMELADAVQD
jgi:hypothetical protein